MTVAQVTDVVDDGLGLLIGRFKDRPRLAAWISSYLDEIQELQDAIWSVIYERLLENAVGEQLEILGQIVGQARREESDDRYRILIRARIGINRSNGHPNELQEIAEVILEGLTFEFIELYPASILVDVSESCEFGDLLHEMLQQATSGGADITVHWFDDDLAEGETLAWAEGDDFVEDEPRGFGSDDMTAEVGEGGRMIAAN